MPYPDREPNPLGWLPGVLLIVIASLLLAAAWWWKG
jgi:hypothetical protein